MKKFIQISVVVLLVFAVAVMAFTATRTSSAMAAGTMCRYVGWNSCLLSAVRSPSLHELASGSICPSVGWNTRSFSCLSALSLSGTDALAYQLAPGATMDVGWNS